MNRRQKVILRDFVTVLVVTAVAVLAMIIFRGWVDRLESMQAMRRIGQMVLQYQKDYGSVPPETYVAKIRENLKGNVRLGKLQYRALWIEPDSTADEILAYAEKNYRSLLVGEGYIVLRLDGRVEWMDKQKFETIFEHQRSPKEIQIQQQQ